MGGVHECERGGNLPSLQECEIAVQDGYADLCIEGAEYMDEFVIIVFCPFCGVKLDTKVAISNQLLFSMFE